MNKKLTMAVAGAVMAFGATAANAGITIPAGDWTIDIGGNVNAFYTSTSGDGADSSNVRTGLLPSALGIGGKTRQNDLDIAFQFTFFVGADDGGALSSVGGGFNGGGLNAGAAGANSLNVRQAYGSFGDASWGTIKFGRDLGIFGSDAILSDMTLLGVGTGAAGAGGSSTLGRIGSGYIYADWVGQISYASPNWNGFSFAVGLRDPWTSGSATADNDNMGFEGKVTYEWAGDVSGKVWLGAISQKFEDDALAGIAGVDDSFNGRAVEIGGKIAVGGFGLVGHYYDGKGVDQSVGLFGLGVINDEDADGGYVQATYTLPGIGTKLGLSYGESNYDLVGGGDAENSSWIVGAYHPLTKSLNLVAEYTDQTLEATGVADFDTRTVSLGAIMFF